MGDNGAKQPKIRGLAPGGRSAGRAVAVGCAIGLLALGAALPALGATLVRTFDFTASNFYALPPITNTIPYNTVTGSVIIQFDTIGPPVTNSIVAIILKDLSLPSLGSPIAFDYDPSTDTLVVGGYQSGADGAQSGTDDFVLSIQSASSATPRAVGLTYTSSRIACCVFQSEDVSLNLGGAAVPEPGSWALVLIGFGGLGATLRGVRRRQAPQAI